MSTPTRLVHWQSATSSIGSRFELVYLPAAGTVSITTKTRDAFRAQLSKQAPGLVVESVDVLGTIMRAKVRSREAAQLLRLVPASIVTATTRDASGRSYPGASFSIAEVYQLPAASSSNIITRTIESITDAKDATFGTGYRAGEQVREQAPELAAKALGGLLDRIVWPLAAVAAVYLYLVRKVG